MAYYGIPTKAIHEQWLGLVQPVGLVVAPAVLTKLELVPEQRTARLSALQLELTGLLDEAEGVNDQPVKVVSSFRQLATELLDWGDSDLVEASALETVPEVVLSEYGETLRPTHGVLKLEGEGLQALVLDLSQWRNASGTLTPQWDRDLDAAWNPTGNGWDATPQQRFERLLKETEHPIGLLFNGTQLRLVHAPRGESSGHITMPLEPMAEVAGRPMLGALELLLGVDRLFGGNPEQRLPALLAASRKNQNEVSTRLAEQVLEALWELLLGFDAAERIAQDNGRSVLGALPTTEEGQKQLYGGLITVLLRLVFLLYAEDEELMPRDSLYGQHYSVSSLADRLRQERFEHQSAMADRRGAWASLLSLFRLVYDGGGADPSYLPARHGKLFDPDAYPFLEGRDTGSFYDEGILINLPALSDDVVEKVLSKLIWLDGERLSYRALDVEQIGSVYEGIMGFTVEQAQGPSVGITYRPSRQKITITVVVDAEQLLAVSPGKREKWLDDQTGVTLKLPAKVKKDLKDATTLTELCVALDKKLSTHTPNTLPAGSLILQPTAERRRSGSHYTPRALTEPIVAEAFRPWLERCNHKPTAEQILALKVCDPAMGSGAFLVAVCRFLAGWLVEAWERDGYPDDFREEWDKDIVARRRIAQSCLYGVDKNPFAVNLAKLSLWLVTLSKELPFTFVDHALKCGDSLVGYSVKEIRAAMSEVQLGFLDAQNRIYEQMGIDRRESFAFDSLSDADYDSKKLRLDEQIKATEGLRQAGDLMVAAFFAKTKPKERADKQQVYLARLSGAFNDEGLQDSIQEIRDRLAAGEKGITPFHWDLEFPEVLGDGSEGFDAIIGNPPFIGGSKIYGYLGKGYPDWLRNKHKETEGKGVDIVVHFFRAAETLLNTEGAFSLIAQSSLCEGDSRKAGLCHLIQNGWTIFSATSRLKWPGAANVVICLTALSRAPVQNATWNKKTVCNINSHLMPVNTEMNPSPLVSMSDTCFVGCNLYGEGFLFSDQIPAGESGSMAEALELIAREPKLNEVIKPYIGGQEISNSPTQSGYRMAINFRDMTKNEAMQQYQEAFRIVEERVKPERDRISGDYSVAESRKQNWWLYGTYTPALYNAIEQLDHVAAASYTSFFFTPS
ncbi:N-6 DNA methylase, partial [Cyanobium sp. BA20m-p-22]|uniref:Eco57I restriction-modification methylase domain-containing protein n=1 Tax=Cyanobium sp. BA20m-p-22 TaxID=2823704 RepID=UPI0020CFBA62